MPLPHSERVELHHRQIDMHGYRRKDGLYEIEGRVTDRKPDAFTFAGGPTVDAGNAIHDMWVRLVIDEDYVVRDALASSEAYPYQECLAAAYNLKKMKGASIVKGWTREVKTRLGGVECCTHLMEVLIPLGSAAFQTLVVARRQRPLPVDEAGKPRQIDSCYAYASDRPVVAHRWPEYYTGPRTSQD